MPREFFSPREKRLREVIIYLRPLKLLHLGLNLDEHH